MLNQFNYKKIDADLLKQNCNEAPTENPFFQKKVVFTGDMQTWDRPTAAYLLQKLGADVNTSISKSTHIVIFGDKVGPAKLNKVIDLIHEGCCIKMMNERIFNLVIEPYKSMIK